MDHNDVIVTTDKTTATNVTIAAITIIAMIGIPYWFLHGPPTKKVKMGVPVVQASIWTCLCNFLAPDGPDRLVRISKELQSSIFLFPGINLYIIGDPNLARNILNDAGTVKDSTLSVAGDRLSKGDTSFMAVADCGPNWKRGRKSIVQGFVNQGRMIQIVTDETNEWIKNQLLPLVDNKLTSFDAFHELQHLTISVISKIGFDYDIKRDESAGVIHGLRFMMQEYFRDSLQNPFRIMVGNYCEGNVKGLQGT